MAASGQSILGLVELQDELLDTGIQATSRLHVLQGAFSERLKGWVRSKDQCRLLNDNRVCVILKDLNSQGELKLAAAKLERIFMEPHIHLGKPMPLKVVAGFAEFDSEITDLSQAMEQAGIALIQAKHSAHLFEVYSPTAVSDQEAEAALLGKMELALELGEFELYYQPKVHAGFRTLIGAEALMRWHTSDRQIILPDEFIDIAEKNEIIKPMTCWAIKAAVGQLARWPAELSIAVNISPVLLLDDMVLAVVRDALDIYGVEPHRLTLEVTEKVMAENQERMLSQLAKLRDIGVKISLDDFGTGFSSLAYFRDLPVDEIKIDKSFVLQMLESEKDYAIVKAVIDLAHNFSLKVVAEGVETFALADKLSDMHCDILQGYVFDMPLRREDFEKNYRL